MWDICCTVLDGIVDGMAVRYGPWRAAEEFGRIGAPAEVQVCRESVDALCLGGTADGMAGLSRDRQQCDRKKSWVQHSTYKIS